MTKKTLLLAALFGMASLFAMAAPASAQKGDAAGCMDDPLFPVRMPGYRIAKCESKAFESYQFHTLKPPRFTVEGQYTKITYAVDKREDERSALEVVRNYENAIRKIGGTIKGVDPKWWVNGVVTVAGKEAWVEAEKGNGTIWLYIVRKQDMQQTIVADAAALTRGLESSGHMAVEGIYFDTGKSDLKPESAQAIGEVAKMLEANASLKLFVVGHTDTVGNTESNLQLSRARAAAVVAALTRAGIAAARLEAFGNGPFAPVPSNASEEGRAQNRRVELVKR